ncbi:Transcription factor, SBP-box [Gossypium australe]|uniref:Transcription factor, SBP-box n=1 Tax=Gossypium australe TaxID=47621 RepID=A0A5B6WRS5_9ROSI|nr:Transcription factor, SBP-box [Gossypium australe]
MELNRDSVSNVADALLGKRSNLLQTYQGSKFLGTSNVFQGESKERSICSPQSAIPIANGQFVAKSSFHMHGIGKQYVPGTFSLETEARNDPNVVEELYEHFSGHAHHSFGKSALVGSYFYGMNTIGVGQEGSIGSLCMTRSGTIPIEPILELERILRRNR